MVFQDYVIDGDSIKITKKELQEANKKTTRTLYHITAISGEVTHYHQDLVDAAVELLLKFKSR